MERSELGHVLATGIINAGKFSVAGLRPPEAGETDGFVRGGKDRINARGIQDLTGGWACVEPDSDSEVLRKVFLDRILTQLS